MHAPAVARPDVVEAPSIFANTAALVLAYAVPRAFTLLAAVVAARVLGVTVFGEYSTAAALAVTASIIATLGMQPLLIREMARAPHRAPMLLSAAHTVKVATVALMAFGIAVAAPVGFPPIVLAATALLAVGYALGAFIENLAAYFQAIERMHVWAQASGLAGLIGGAAGILLVVSSRQLLWFCAAPAIGQTAALAWLLRRAPASVRHLPRPTLAAIRALVRQLVPFAVAFIATTVYYRIDVLLLSRMKGPAEVGLYGAAHKFVDVTQALALAGAGALLPRLARKGALGGAAIRRVFGAVMATALPVAALLFASRDVAIRTLFGPDYAAAAPILEILAPALIPLAVNMFALAALAAADAMAAAAVAYSVAAIANTALNIAWIPSHGALGAARAMLISETGLGVALLAILWLRRGS